MVHIYYGSGKGKTTAAMGLALRALGQGLRVTISQFLKDGTSGEINPLKNLGATIICDTAPMPFVWQMTEKQRQDANLRMQNVFAFAKQSVEQSDVIILDEILCAMQLGMLSCEEIVRFLQSTNKEVVLTGTVAADVIENLIPYADYVTEIKKDKHPFDNGATARRGIEY